MLNDVRRLVREELESVGRFWRILAGAKEDVVAIRERTRIEGQGEIVGAFVSVHAHALE
jgi:hypothetical protein